ncbi:hypothetical protein H696_06279 [Fonticula alba]|uniref:Uncharacterized protein n=1 Tax=Fonticula alba TaxID=691883 RepID=A0A058Z188_FONAL|nr:hypothetical protein H696_06279 [Fonticula alba]KCV67302.1 hypothetical protein H696_06279 [Fonticula alba]|eukprot:XP_009498294.1 hypothetical protein H696_06279 [Fonticula alba]
MRAAAACRAPPPPPGETSTRPPAAAQGRARSQAGAPAPGLQKGPRPFARPLAAGCPAARRRRAKAVWTAQAHPPPGSHDPPAGRPGAPSEAQNTVLLGARAYPTRLAKAPGRMCRRCCCRHAVALPSLTPPPPLCSARPAISAGRPQPRGGPAVPQGGPRPANAQALRPLPTHLPRPGAPLSAGPLQCRGATRSGGGGPGLVPPSPWPFCRLLLASRRQAAQVGRAPPPGPRAGGRADGQTPARARRPGARRPRRGRNAQEQGPYRGRCICLPGSHRHLK